MKVPIMSIMIYVESKNASRLSLWLLNGQKGSF